MNLKETLTNEEWAWINRLGQHSNYAVGDSRKTKIVYDWAQQYRYKRVIDDEYCEYKQTDPRFKERVMR
tara:strand:+ start:42 stop:248 length:207 start_codon:yes stop_codon:yes gene_type:complete